MFVFGIPLDHVRFRFIAVEHIEKWIIYWFVLESMPEMQINEVLAVIHELN